MKTKFKKNKVRTHFALSLAISQSRYLGRVRYEVYPRAEAGWWCVYGAIYDGDIPTLQTIYPTSYLDIFLTKQARRAT